VPPAIQEDPTSLNNDEDSHSIPHYPNEVRVSFADKLKYNIDLQIAIYTEPAKLFSEGDKLDFTDSICNVLLQIPEDEYLPSFTATSRREGYLIVTADNEKSRDWLLTKAASLSIWEDRKILAIHAKDMPKLQKGLLWLPGKQKYEDNQIQRLLTRQNPTLSPSDWKIFSRHEEEHGTRILISLTEEESKKIADQDNKIRWSTIRAQFTPIEKVIERRKTLKLEKKETSAAHKTNQSTSSNQPSVANNIPRNTLKRKPEIDLTQPTETGQNNDNIALSQTPEAEKTTVFTPNQFPSLAKRDEEKNAFTPGRALPRSPTIPRSIKRRKEEGPSSSNSPSNSTSIKDFLQRKQLLKPATLQKSNSLPSLRSIIDVQQTSVAGGSKENNSAPAEDGDKTPGEGT